ncbi:restriction endonuclease subunit S [Shewanella putrefaciens]|uniref:restriction endonuclease subunit S n=1 Tax=Shewanella putrefaciens TaxID=24 RepID=UPI0021BF8CE0|nr:restriction endonuclease subunit S [Shewanella putrefaciens]UXK06950.1 restriction endonuclease subunit S [Shewanella putrefaciens]
MSDKYVAYPEYKDSGVGFLNKLPFSWGIKKVNYLFSFGRGLNITKANLEDSGVPVVNYGEVHSKFGFEINPDIHNLKRVSEDYLKTTPAALLQNGDFVFADTSEDLDGAGNFTQFVGNGLLFAGYHTVVLRPNDGNVSRYLAYAFESTECRNQIRLAVKGVKVFSITQSILKDVMLPMPPPEEQIIVAAFLDYETARIDLLIAKQQRLIELLKEKRQAVISHVVTKGLNPNASMKDSGVEWLGQVPEHWVVRRLKHHIISMDQGWSPQCEARLAEEDEFGVMKVGCVNGGVFRFSEHKALPAELEPKTEYRLKKGQLLVSRANTRELVGSAAVVDADYDQLLLCDKLYRIKLSSDASPEFVALLLGTSAYRGQIELSASGASDSMQNIGQSTIKELPIAVPPMDEANDILKYVAARLCTFDCLNNQLQQQNLLLQERRTALISAAVTGKIDVRGWNASNERNSV